MMQLQKVNLAAEIHRLMDAAAIQIQPRLLICSSCASTHARLKTL